MPEIFFSAGSDGSALYNANASAAAGVLTLATPAVGKIGLGDEIREGANRYYIRQRNSSTEFLIQTPTGGTAITFSLTGITIYRAFASVNAAENGASGASYLNTVDLVTNTINLTIIQMNDGADSNAVDIDGWTVNSTYYVTIRTPIGESEIGTRARHMGKLDTSFAHFVNDTSVSGFIACHDPQIRLTGLQVDASSGTGYRRPIRYFGYTAGDSDGLRISSCIVKGNGSGDWQTSAIAAATNVVGVTVRIWNCVATNSKDAFEFYQATTTYFIYNCTAQGGPAGTTGLFNVSSGDVTAKNCIAQDTAAGSCFVGTFNANSTNNCSDDNTQPGGSGRNGEVTFVNEGADDLHLSAADTIAQGYGADLYTDSDLPVTDDVDGYERPNGGTWDIGADQLTRIGVSQEFGQAYGEEFGQE